MKWLLAFLLILLSLGCTETPSRQTVDYAALATSARSRDTLTENDYWQMLNGLESMFADACEKALNIIDSGYQPSEVRRHLQLDTMYCQMAHSAVIIDSALLRYLKTPGCSKDLKLRYRRSLAEFVRQGRELGLR